jgi:hypothetical protein
MERHRSDTKILFRSLRDGAAFGGLVGAAVGAAVGMSSLMGSPPTAGSVLFSLVFGGIAGAVVGTWTGALTGIAVGLLTAVLVVYAGGRRLTRRRARMIGALAPVLAALSLGVWHITETWPLVLAFCALASPLGAWRTPYVLDDWRAKGLTDLRGFRSPRP